MKKTHLNLLVPQWQGGGQDLSTYKGGQELKNYYIQGVNLTEVDVSTKSISEVKNHILGYNEILKQLVHAKLQITKCQPETIFTVGGGCDADLLSISYLTSIAKGNMTLLYFDAHGDLNTPKSSGSKCFYGMSLRTLLGDGDEKIVNTIFSKLLPSQLVMLGTRDLDEAEIDYIKEKNISMLPVDNIEQSVENVMELVKEKGHNKIYIHIDLDVLDPSEFPHVPVPVLGGLKSNTLITLLQRLDQEFKIIGLGILEYSPSGEKENKLIQEIIQLGCNLQFEEIII